MPAPGEVQESATSETSDNDGDKVVEVAEVVQGLSEEVLQFPT